MIYLDNASTSWPKPEPVFQAVSDCLRNAGGNPGRGGHSLARAADRILYEARQELAWLFKANNPASITFAYSATDALNAALFGLLKPGDKVVTTSMEHNAVARPLRELETRGVRLTVIKCDQTGRLPLHDLKKCLSGARAVVIGHGSNVTGTMVSLADVGILAAEAGAILVVDAAQTGGVEEIDVAAMGVDILAFSGHKGLLGPQGTGGIYLRPGLDIAPLRYGGTGSQSDSDRQPSIYPDRLESGTPNTPGIAGLLAWVRYIRETGQGKIRQTERELTARLFEGLAATPGVTVYGPAGTENRTAVVSFTIKGIDSGEVAWRLDRDYGVACRAGLHCAPWAHNTIGTLQSGTVRFSPGYFNSDADIIAAVEAVKAVAVTGGSE